MIHHVQLLGPPGLEPAMRGFYAGVLGLEEIPKPPVLAARGGCWFRGTGLAAGPRACPATIELHISPDPDFMPARKAHPGLLWPDLDGLAARLEDAGHPVRWDEDFPGMRRFYTDDPYGNRLEFLTPVE